MTLRARSLLRSDTSRSAYIPTPPNTPRPPPPHPNHPAPPGPTRPHPAPPGPPPPPGPRRLDRQRCQLHVPGESAVSFPTRRSLRAFGDVGMLRGGLLKGAIRVTLIAPRTLYFATPQLFSPHPHYFRHTPIIFATPPLFSPHPPYFRHTWKNSSAHLFTSGFPSIVIRCLRHRSPCHLHNARKE